MHSPDVTLTDYLLALEGFAFCVLLARQSGQARLKRMFIAFFAAIGLAAFAGGTVHGFFPDAGTTSHSLLWLVTLLSIGVMAMEGWRIGAAIALTEFKARILGKLALAAFAAYAAFVIFVRQEFLVAIAFYIPATLFLLGAFIHAYRQNKSRPVMFGIIGLLLTFTSSALQQLKIPLHPDYFDHNALYHLLQFIAVWLLFLSARYFSGNGIKKATD